MNTIHEEMTALDEFEQKGQPFLTIAAWQGFLAILGLHTKVKIKSGRMAASGQLV